MIKSFPISRITVIWSQEGKDDNPEAKVGLKEGRIRHGISFQYMFIYDEEVTSTMFIDEWWVDYRKDFLWGVKAKLLSKKAEYLGYHTFCPYMGTHFSRDMDATDEEILEAFEEFVKDKETNEPDYRLMEADDRSLWSGPCSCEHCVANGVRIIEHKRDMKMPENDELDSGISDLIQKVTEETKEDFGKMGEIDDS